MAEYLDKTGLQHFWTGAKDKLKDLVLLQVNSVTVEETWTEEGVHAKLLDALKKRRIVLAQISGEGKLIPAELAGTNTEPDLNTETDSLYVRFVSPADNSKLINLFVDSDDSITVEIYDASSSYVTSGTLGNYATIADLKSVLDINYNTATKKLELKYGTEILTEVDATPFIKDGMLDDTDIITVSEGDTDLISSGFEVGEKLIKFVWKTYEQDGLDNAEVLKTDYIKISDIAPDLNTENTKVSEDITVAGGPLASLAASVFTDGVIPKDMSVQEVLFKLFCKEIFPTNITTTPASLSSKISAPTITMVTTTVEVGTEVAYTVSNGASSATATPHKASGFTYGYSAADDNTQDSANTSVSATCSTPTVLSNTSKLTVTATENETVEVTGTATAGSAVEEGSIIAIEGTNKVSATNTSATHTCSCTALPVYYACSNLGNTNDGGKTYTSQAKDADDSLTSTSTTNSNSKQFTAQYKYFIGSYNEMVAANYTSDIIRNLNGAKSGFITVNGTTTISSDTWTSAGYSVVIACPSKYKLASITDSIGNDNMKAFHSKTDTGDYSDATGSDAIINVTTGSKTTEYHVYVCGIPNSAQASFKNITLKLA